MTITPAAACVLPPTPTLGVTRLVHCADLHLRPSAHGSAARGKDFFTAAMSVLGIAKQRGAHAVINAGDFIDAPELLSSTFEQVQEFHRTAKELALPVYTIMGNHDACEPSWASHVEDGTTGIICADNRIIKIGGLTTWHLPFMSPEELRTQLQGDTPKDTGPLVVVWHGAVKEWTGYPVEGAIEAADFCNLGFSAVLLGDIHITNFKQVTGQDAKPFLIGYPGATELARENDPLQHYCAVIDFHDATGAVLGYELVQVNHRYVLPLRIDTEQHLAESLVRVKEAAAQHRGRIMVLAAVADTITGAAAAIRREAGVDAVVRVTTYPVISFAQAMAQHGSLPAGAASRKAEDYVEARIPGNRELSVLARQLCNPDAPSNDLLRAYATKQLETLTP